MQGNGQTRQTILGANGTIGTPLAAELRTYTDTIRLVSRNPRRVNPTDELLPLDLSRPADMAANVEKAVAGSAIVYLMTGFDYSLSVWKATWPPLMAAVIAACIRHKSKLVFFDNVYMYDKDAIPRMTEASPLNPPSKKGAVRKQIAEMLMEATRTRGLQALIARSADFYGPDNGKSLITEVIIKNQLKGKKANWMMDAGKRHSLTYTPDAAKATAMLGNAEDTYGQVWHLPTDPAALTGRELAALAAKEMGAPEGVALFPIWMMKILGLFMSIMRELPEMMYQYDRDYIFDCSKFNKRFRFQTTTYAEGIKSTAAAALKAAKASET
ncbi:MAG: NAD-dependent epimerase/dehydratase family protein, partial [Fibrobacteria bacterium]